MVRRRPLNSAAAAIGMVEPIAVAPASTLGNAALGDVPRRVEAGGSGQLWSEALAAAACEPAPVFTLRASAVARDLERLLAAGAAAQHPSVAHH